jgi:hypothetical protein
LSGRQGKAQDNTANEPPDNEARYKPILDEFHSLIIEDNYEFEDNPWYGLVDPYQYGQKSDFGYAFRDVN